MADVSVENVYRELRKLRSEVAELKERVSGEYELSDWAKQRIEEYETGETETVSHDKIKEKFEE